MRIFFTNFHCLLLFALQMSFVILFHPHEINGKKKTFLYKKFRGNDKILYQKVNP